MTISSLCKFAYGIALTTASLGVLSLSVPAYAGGGPAIIYGSGSYDNYGAHKHKPHKKTNRHKQHKHKKKHGHGTVTSSHGYGGFARHVFTPKTVHNHNSEITHRPHMAHSSGLSVYRPAVRPACPSGSRRAADGLCMSTQSRSHTYISHAGSPRAVKTHTSKTHANTFSTSHSTSWRTSVVRTLPVVQPRPVMRQQVRIVRPIVYVPYPVPTPVIMSGPGVSPCQADIRYSRYGNAWPNAGGGCG